MSNHRETTHNRVRRITEVSSHVADALEVPEVLSEHAPGVYLEKVLTDIGLAIAALTDVRDELVLEALRDQSVTREALQGATGLGLTTLQRWKQRLHAGGNEFEEINV